MNIDALSLKITSECNANCEFCYLKDDNFRASKVLTLEELEKLFIEFREVGGDSLQISGGEPLLRDDLNKIIEYASDLGIYTKLATNGILLDKSRITQLINSGLNELYYSLGDMQDETVLDNFVEIIKQIRDIDLQQMKMGVNIITTSDFVLHADKYIHWLHNDVNVDFISLIPPKPGGDRTWFLKKRIGIKDYQKLADIIYSSDEIDIKLDCAHCILERILDTKLNNIGNGSYNCAQDRKGIAVWEDGSVYPCFFESGKKFFMGNIREKSFVEIMKNSALKEFCTDVQENYVIIPPCLC